MSNISLAISKSSNEKSQYKSIKLLNQFEVDASINLIFKDGSQPVIRYFENEQEITNNLDYKDE